MPKDAIGWGSAWMQFIAGTTLATLVLTGCSSKTQQETDAQLRRSVVESAKRQLREAEANPQKTELERENRVERLGLTAERLEELDKTSGPTAYRDQPDVFGPNLYGEQTDSVSIGLEQTIRSAVTQNLGVQSARIVPSVSSSQLVTANAAFDWAFFASAQLSLIDAPTTQTLSGAIPVGAAAQVVDQRQLQLGIQRDLVTGGTVSIDWTLDRVNQRTPGFNFVPDPSSTAAIGIDITQPLLRGAGSEVATSQIRIAENAERRSISELRATLTDIVITAEEAYWQLGQAHENLRIQRRLLERGEATSEKIRQRGRLDATAAQIADAQARVEERRAAVIEAENTVRAASDRLKSIVNDPDLTVGGEALLVPSDRPIGDPLTFSLLDAIETSLENRPEVRQALLAIDDASIRSRVADNQRLPQLDLTFQARARSLDNDATEATFQPFDGDFVDYLVGLRFLRPIGNRVAESNFRATTLARMQSVIDYRAATQQVVLDVKTALRDVVTNHTLIEQRRAARLAAAENLRALTVQIELTEGFSAGNLDLLLRRQESLALAEAQEVAALTAYNIAVADLYRAMGTNLTQNKIELEAPSADVAWSK